MALDLTIFAEKLKKYRDQFQLSISELSITTGITEDSLESFEKSQKAPTGDEVLILSDFFKCDYKYFISSEKLAPFEQTETLFRRHGSEFSREDRWAIQEFLFLSECESYLTAMLGMPQFDNFVFKKPSTNHKTNGIAAAKELRKHFKYNDNQVVLNLYMDFRSIGIHTFRRVLQNSKISGWVTLSTTMLPDLLPPACCNISEASLTIFIKATGPAARPLLVATKSPFGLILEKEKPTPPPFFLRIEDSLTESKIPSTESGIGITKQLAN